MERTFKIEKAEHIAPLFAIYYVILDEKKRLYHDYRIGVRHTASLKIKKGHCDLFLYTPNK